MNKTIRNEIRQDQTIQSNQKIHDINQKTLWSTHSSVQTWESDWLSVKSTHGVWGNISPAYYEYEGSGVGFAYFMNTPIATCLA